MSTSFYGNNLNVEYVLYIREFVYYDFFILGTVVKCILR